MNKTNIEWVKNPDGSQGYTHNPISGCNAAMKRKGCLHISVSQYLLPSGRVRTTKIPEGDED